ncbi:glycine betaine ABC transporter substrate-binding protein [Corynebacterium terpenotabidum]|uniref:ABC-type glycine betaine transport system substrate-binding domain-containing protein n=1 Tax=Corynebacterium terpenotabidum Y-11 TaxID=1200352 RepID=S4XF34_9CORY|nr:glycine betaine ABC transporter substrate-binding protein [Corynebacterium terpenotabidum]AGP31151.1 hypothetical protein A606_07520 [Corynebacterium terpenotabidum Y-11]
MRGVPGRRAAALLAVVTAVGVVCAGCSSGATSPTHQAVSSAVDSTVVIGVTGDPLQQALADVYRAGLEEQGRTVEETRVDDADRISGLRSGDLTLVTGCVGELLDTLDAAKGRELRELYRAEQAEGEVDAETWRDITHSTMVSALPTDLQATDPGLAVACEDESLPQNIVAVYRKPTMDRADRKALNDVAGGVTTADLQAAAEDVDQATE